MKSNSTAFLIKIKLRHSLGRPSRSDFVQSKFMEENSNGTVPTDYIYSDFNISNNIICDIHSQENKKALADIVFGRTSSAAYIHRTDDLL